MKILDFSIDKQIIVDNQNELADTIKVLLINHDESLFEKLDFDNNFIFLEPMLFLFFQGK